MTPRYRAKLLRSLAVGALLAAASVYSVLRGARPIYLAVMIVATVGYFVVLALQIAISRCPRCGCMIDLREGGFSCPKCGVWIPPGKGAPQAGG
jgi:hypothetical protein